MVLITNVVETKVYLLILGRVNAQDSSRDYTGIFKKLNEEFLLSINASVCYFFQP